MKTVAVLCADSRTVYRTIPGVDIYDAKRDCRTFRGGMPIVAHPPCRAWSAHCRHQAKPPPGEAELAPLCVAFLQSCGGILEHPAHSRLWQHCNLPLPGDPPVGPFWSLAVDQSWFGNPLRKKTWLLFAHIEPRHVEIPFRLHDWRGDVHRWNRLSKRKRSATCPEMAAWLVGTARMVRLHGGDVC